MSSQSERAPRFEVDLRVGMFPAASRERTESRVRNISGDGMLLEHCADAKPQDFVFVEVPVAASQRRILIMGQVRWRRGDKVGVKLKGMTPHHRHRFQELVSGSQRLPVR